MRAPSSSESSDETSNTGETYPSSSIGSNSSPSPACEARRRVSEALERRTETSTTHLLSIAILPLPLLLPPLLLRPLLVLDIGNHERLPLGLHERLLLRLGIPIRLEVLLARQLVNLVTVAVVVENKPGRVSVRREHRLLRLSHLELALGEVERFGKVVLVEHVVRALESDEVVTTVGGGGGLVGSVDELAVVVGENRLTLAVEHAVVLGLDAAIFLRAKWR